MTDKNISNCNCGTLSGVDCGAVNCKYHGMDDCCHADCISVQSRTAIKKSETFCGTFAPKRT